MNTLAVEVNPQAYSVEFNDSSIVVSLIDGRAISAPLVWFPRLSQASQQELENWQILGDGEGIHWPDIDEDLSVMGLLLGNH